MKKTENTVLFEHYNDFVKKEKSIPSLLNTDSELVPKVFRGFQYPISSWPIIINQKKKKDLKNACIAIPRLLYEIPELYFHNDLEKISEFYFDGDTHKGQFSLLCHNKKEEVSCRLDLIQTQEGFKVLEVNMGSSLGGMEFQNFEPLMRQLHPILSPENGKFIYRSTQSLYVAFLINKIEAYVSSDDRELGIFFINDTPEQQEGKKIVKDFFNELLVKELHKRDKTGLTYMDEATKLKFKNDGLYYKGKKIHTILAMDYESNDISLDVFRALLINKVYFPDHLGTIFMRDKRNLALLRKLATANKFSTEDNETILKYIPWTEIVTTDVVQYQGENHKMPELLADKRENFVIKIADGLQGNNVYVGKFQEQHVWEEIIQKAIKAKIYIAQEFSESIQVSAPNIDNQWENHQLVWGSFGFGKTYGGSWVRMASNKNDLGVVNSAKGAVEVIVYETSNKNTAPKKRLFKINKK